jgi:uncharacterized protein YbjT (DUF2867 family)
MSKVLGVIGATGQQGGSVVDFVLNDPELKSQYAVRAFTRDASKPAAKALAENGVEVVQGDVEDPASLKTGLAGVHTLFFMTAVMPGSEASEYDVGKAIVDCAVGSGVQYIVFSTLPFAEEISNGNEQVPHFDNKAKLEQYIRSLPVKSSFYCPGFFMQNLVRNLAPQPQSDGSLAIQCIIGGDTNIPMVDAVGDTGNCVGAILAQSDKYEGKVLFAASEYTNFKEAAKTMSKVYGKQISYQQVDKKNYLSFLPEVLRKDMISMFSYYERFGFYGPNTAAFFNENEKSPRVPVTSLLDFFKTTFNA